MVRDIVANIWLQRVPNCGSTHIKCPPSELNTVT